MLANLSLRTHFSAPNGSFSKPGPCSAPDPRGIYLNKLKIHVLGATKKSHVTVCLLRFAFATYPG